MKKIIVALDSFKASLSSEEAANCVKKGILTVFPACEVKTIKIADGGEGTVEALLDTLKGRFVELSVNDPLMRPVKAKYGIIDDGKTALIEMASASGLSLIAPSERNPLKTTTYGTGELIKDALERGCRNFLIAIGGSATNDAGTGMLQALGFRFYNSEKQELKQGGEILSEISLIDTDAVLASLKNAKFTVACDVTNPFSGINGAAHIYAAQKGADEETIKTLDKGLAHFAKIIKSQLSIDIQDLAGSGAAGGLGGAFFAFLNADSVSGISTVLDTIKFNEIIENADLIITGEGKIDKQSIMGKALQGILSRAKEQHVPVIAIGGSVEDTAILNRQGFAAIFPIIPSPVTLEKAMEADFAAENIQNTIIQLMKVIRTFSEK